MHSHGIAQIFYVFVKNADVLVVISTSGISVNVVKAAEYARINGLLVVSSTGAEIHRPEN